MSANSASCFIRIREKLSVVRLHVPRRLTLPVLRAMLLTRGSLASCIFPVIFVKLFIKRHHHSTWPKNESLKTLNSCFTFVKIQQQRTSLKKTKINGTIWPLRYRESCGWVAERSKCEVFSPTGFHPTHGSKVTLSFGVGLKIFGHSTQGLLLVHPAQIIIWI